MSRVEIALLVALSVTGHMALAVQLGRKRPAPPPPHEQTVAIEVEPPPVEPPVVPPQEERPRPAAPRPVARPVTREPLTPPPPVESPAPAADVDPGPLPQGDEALPAASGAPSPAPPGPPAPPAPLVAAHEGANYLKNPRPAYPELALQEGWEGQVLLRVRVSPEGRATVISIERASGRKTLDDAAVEAVRGWSFVPARQGTVPLAGWVTVPIVFRLQQGE